MITAIYAGSFDPFTRGHEDIARRAVKIFDKVIIGVGKHRTKPGFFPVEERLRLINSSLCDLGDRIEACSFEGLLFEFARKRGASVIVRGLRAHVDFDTEFAMAMANRDAAPELETVFLVPDTSHQFVSSSLVREIASHGGDFSHYVHPAVVEAFAAKDAAR